MKATSLIILIFFFSLQLSKADIPVTVTNPSNTTPNLSSVYSSFALALADLNLVTAMTGPVTLTLAGSNSESAPVTGFTIGSASLNAALNSVNTVNINTSGGTVTLNAGTGGTGTPGTAVQDGILNLAGADWITIDGLTLADGNTVNPETMEYGIGLFKAGVSDGCQNNTIKNCSITLNRINNATGTAPATEGSRGINIVNSTSSAQTTILTVTSAAGSNSNNKFYSNTIQNCNIGISLIGFAAVSPFTLADTGNDIGGSSAATGNSILNFGGAPAAVNLSAGIKTLAQYDINISYNIINSNNGSGVNHPTMLRGILNGAAVSANVSITNNTISLKCGATASSLTAIENSAGATAAGNTVSINNNTITGCAYPTATTGSFTAIDNFNVSAAILNINSNSILNNQTNSVSGATNFIRVSGIQTVALNINNNNMSGMTFNAANSGLLTGIANTNAVVTASLSISGNNFESINYSVPSSGINMYINWTSATNTTANINSNKFTNLNVLTSGSVTFLKRNANAMTSTGNEHCDSNSIVTGFFKGRSGGIVTFFKAGAGGCPNGSQMTENFNNFSNVTLSGTTTVDCWINTEGVGSSSGPSKTINNNTFSNITTGGSAFMGISTGSSGANSSISNNTISNITNTNGIIGINIGSSNGQGTHTCAFNTLSNLSGNSVSALQGGSSFINSMYINNNKIGPATANGTGSQLYGINLVFGKTNNIFMNKIYDLVNNNISGSVTGITVANSLSVTPGAVNNIYNNLIGNLRAPFKNGLSDAIKGINLGNFNDTALSLVYYNTVYIPAQVSSGTNFSSAAIYHTAYTSSSTSDLYLRNNILVNLATPKGSGNSVAFRRSSGLDSTLANYNSTSNNNLFYAGTPGAANLIYNDGTSTASTLAEYKAGVFTAGTIAPRDAQSVTENPNFSSTTGSSPDFLHINTAIPTQIESGASVIPGFNNDFDNQPRYPNAGYPLNISTPATAPDIGADEFGYTSANQTLTLKNRIQGIQGNRRDTLTINLRSSASPYNIIESKKNVFDSVSGVTVVSFSLAVNGTSYYLEVRHRNSIATWSAAPVLCSSNAMSYDFTSGLSQAYGSNQISVSGVPSFYGGDVNQDETIDASDVSETDNDAFSSVSGYVRTDVTGDDFVDAADVSIVDNNAFNAVSVVRP
ncbi:MAG: hypothetical protein IPG78_19330 [Ignavibacteria bacterium]|nr:hypothetical protein [Ignavibacteria bacterium]